MSDQARATQPFLLMIAGPNGAGKTTLTNYLKRQNVEFGEYINADDIAAALTTGTPDERTRQAQTIADTKRADCIRRGVSFSFETVMSHESKLDVLDAARQAGFRVQMFFVGTDDPRTNVDRIAARVAAGGHAVPQDKIEARWHRTMGFLADAIRRCDRAVIFDNSTVDGQAGPRAVYEWLVGTGRMVAVTPPLVPEWVERYVLQPLRLPT